MDEFCPLNRPNPARREMRFLHKNPLTVPLWRISSPHGASLGIFAKIAGCFHPPLPVLFHAPLPPTLTITP